MDRAIPRVSRARLLALAVVAAAPCGPAFAGPVTRPPAALAASIPPRDASAPGGSEIVARLSLVNRKERNRQLLEQILQGNVPSSLRQLWPVELTLRRESGALSRAVVWVMPDYLAVGSDDDFVRVPLGLDDALTVARRFGFTLPTRKLVDSIHRQAEGRLSPVPMPAGESMTSVAFFWAHNRTIEKQLQGIPRGALISGSKKDVVLTPRLATHKGRVAIYGWMRPDGTPIQPLSTVHGERYADYSHGIRLVSDTVFVDGQARSFFDLLEDPLNVGLLSDEGVDLNARRLLGPTRLQAALSR